tara:strand:- start:188 stop:454 length:267 start_codon:yes stop_codon:yes gene_type:complete
VSKDNNKHRKENKNDPDYGNGPFGAPVEEDGNNNEQNNRSSKPKASTFEVSIDWKLEAERRAWLAAHNEDIAPVRDLFDGGSDITDVV